MQPVPHEQVQYATLGWRAAAVLIDTLIVLFASSLVLAVLMAAGVIDIGLTQTATLQEIFAASRNGPGWLMPLEYGLIFVYFTLFELTGATPGKRLLHLSVRTEDGDPASAGAVVVRNIVRIPEMYLLYVPSAVSCLVSGKRKRLGDFAAHTVVVRRVVHAVPLRAGARPQAPAPAAAAAAPAAGPEAALTSPAAAAGPPPLDQALAALRDAALVVLGAHHLYLRFSELELARGGVEAGDLSPEYAAAWYSLADGVIALQQAHAVAQQSAAREGTTLQAACAGQADLLHLFRELEPYFTAGSDEAVHDAYLKVARGETTA